MRGTPAVVMPADRPASLGIARSLGRRGIPVYGVDADPRAIAMGSRYLTPCPLPQGAGATDEDRLAFLLELGRKLGEKAVLYPVSDDAVMLCSEHRDQLQPYYLFVMPDHDTICSLLTKDGLHRVAQTHQIPDPQMFEVGSRAELETVSGSIPFPVILKPVFSPSWLRPEIVSLLRDDPLSGPPKVAFCRTRDELLDTYDALAVYDGQMIIQEGIPGKDESLVYSCFYVNRESRLLAYFAGEKLRLLPVGFGSASYVRSVHDPVLEELTGRLLAGTRYQGMGGVEFKKDERDGSYKLIEFNARLGMWDSYGARCGVDIPYIAYCDALGDNPSEAPQKSYREGVYWIDLQRDVRAFLLYRKKGLLTFGRWIKSLCVEKEWAVYSSDDRRPASMAFLKLFTRPLNAIAKKRNR